MQWQKGQSGNPLGRPTGYGDVRELARAHTGEAITTLVEIMRDSDAAPSARTSAAQAILDRGWGKSEQMIATAGKQESYADFLMRIAKPRTEGAEVVAGGGRAIEVAANRLGKTCC